MVAVYSFLSEEQLDGTSDQENSKFGVTPGYCVDDFRPLRIVCAPWVCVGCRMSVAG